ncbi:hypothetical protein JCM10212_004928, partial [Sporobolomyces blumeae]
SLDPQRLATTSVPGQGSSYATSSSSRSTAVASSVDPSTLPVALDVGDGSFVPFDSTSSRSNPNANPDPVGSIQHVAPESSSSPRSSSDKHDKGKAKAKDDKHEVIVVSSLKDKPSRSSQALAKKRRRGVEPVEKDDANAPLSGSAAAAVTTPSSSSSSSKGKRVDVEDEGEEMEPRSTTRETVGSPTSQPPVPKKLKRNKKNPASSSASSSTPIVPHDYSSTRSILDEGPATLSGLERRQAEKDQKRKDKGTAAAAPGGGKKSKGFKVDTSDFKMPMRVDNAPKRANVSKSFAK